MKTARELQIGSSSVLRAREHVPSADPEALRAHISHALRNEAVMGWLENQ